MTDLNCENYSKESLWLAAEITLTERSDVIQAAKNNAGVSVSIDDVHSWCIEKYFSLSLSGHSFTDSELKAYHVINDRLQKLKELGYYSAGSRSLSQEIEQC
ncbi:hypothetical protein ACXHQ0_17095 [Vibrio antiquarius]|uniref:Uncharacterized protein n=1 Tax=Vibrio parahaemolyticus TaxID=670 RepID=A0AA46UQI7_VIBPH|nr:MULTISPECIES: hypothetical protein [Vibrio harveyi group]KOE92757.1 hypothetical protein ACS91_01695 [Vibrio parahaemolyticus]MCS0310710.1 hypothetical protein [Vibrio diabolicus]UYV30012.1 hypothetical protein M5598_28920 [Vibrio parahaemolyticus]UYW18948.1 hypothetical protein IF561_27370 [Vibrio parahaemolyticus]